MNEQGKPYFVRLPIRSKHKVHHRLIEIPEALFHLFIRERFLIHTNKPRRANIHPRYRAWVDGETNQLRFAAKATEVDRYGIPSSWKLLITLWLHHVTKVKGEPQYTILWNWHDQVYGKTKPVKDKKT